MRVTLWHGVRARARGPFNDVVANAGRWQAFRLSMSVAVRGRVGGLPATSCVEQSSHKLRIMPIMLNKDAHCPKPLRPRCPMQFASLHPAEVDSCSMARLFGYVLLAFCLILNGVGGAAMGATLPLSTDDACTSASAGWHSGAVSHDTGSPDGDSAAPGAHPAPDEPDCCEPERCDGACAQYAVTIPELMPIVGSDDLGLGYRAGTVPSHVDPALRRAVRPPIG